MLLVRRADEPISVVTSKHAEEAWKDLENNDGDDEGRI